MKNMYAIYREDDTKKLDKLEEALLDFAKNYKLNKWRIPALISGDILDKCGYFRTMPNQLTIAGFYQDSQCSEILENKESKCVCEDMYLTPAACIHFYPELQNLNIVNELITTNARVYRHESGEFSRNKLWDFNVREFVAVGNKEYVEKFLIDFRKQALCLAQKYDSKARIDNANDYFYPTKENKIKEKYQRANNLKYELLTRDNLAIASFNFHGDHFSRTFRFDKNGEIVTGCVGFGLDRWLELLNSKRQ